jgi:uncharacterized protein YbbC (DUF1343 family)/CubicO group peptidase (beta-lactamase class C family)
MPLPHSRRALRLSAVLIATVAFGPAQPAAQSPSAPPATPPRFDAARLARIDGLVEEAIARQEMPGAVVVVGSADGVEYAKAFGRRAVDPATEPMTLDTVFDAASLTKVVATTTAVMILVEEGRLRLNDTVARHVPGFERYGKDKITLRHLLTHTSGLRPDVDWSMPWTGYDTAIELACEEVPVADLDERIVYSDINFFLLGHIVSRVSGQPLEAFTSARVFEPLGMADTMFLPPETLRPRVAPTERCTQYGYPCAGPGATILRGVVHDPTARRMGGVAGHAGLFTTGADLARFARALLGGGALDGARVLSPLSVARMTSPATPPSLREVRGLGWDIDSRFSQNRGELLPRGSFGHTGFTGTSLWVDPATRTFVVFLSNRVHPDGRGEVTSVRARVATAAAAALLGAPPTPPAAAVGSGAFGGFALAPSAPNPGGQTGGTNGHVLTGVDVLRAEQFARLKGRRIGLVTNHTGRARDGATTIDLLHAAPGVTLVALFSPEHGIRGILDDKVPTSVDEETGLTIHSLYGETRRPTAAMLQGIDTLVVDLQDIGARIYTYASTTAYVMEAAAPRGIKVVVLDRPNPINGWQIEGPVLDADATSFVGYFPMPMRHGMTLGELATLFNAENKIGADLEVVAMSGWRRDMWFDATGLPWVNPSPNMRNLHQAMLYPGIGAIEGTNISVGRGTDTPFEQIGAPWIDGTRLAAELNAAALPGIRFYPVQFTPSSSRHAGQLCGGVFMVVTDRDALRPVRVGVEIAAALVRRHGDRFEFGSSDTLLGSREVIEHLRRGTPTETIAAAWPAGEAKWRLLRAKYLLYR